MKSTGKPARARDRRAAFLGRDRELDHLKDALHQAAIGKGRAELVCGEPGIGKTTLLEELSDYVETCGITVYAGCCLDDPGCAPYWPWSQILSSLVSGMKQSLFSDAVASDADLVGDAFPAVKAAIRSPPRERVFCVGAGGGR